MSNLFQYITVLGNFAMNDLSGVTLVGNQRAGGLYRDDRRRITAVLEVRFDAIARNMSEFYTGRFNLRLESIDALMRGMISHCRDQRHRRRGDRLLGSASVRERRLSTVCLPTASDVLDRPAQPRAASA